MLKKYRPNVAAILQKNDGKILICQRADHPECWQFPQGGIDEGESSTQALHRELEEEIGLLPSQYEVLAQQDGYRYDFPADTPFKKGFAGQQQTYYLCRFLAKDSDISLDHHQVEFIDFRWIDPADFQAEWLPPFKREVVMRAITDLLN
ncbi:MAG: RNA pyrophosphohydrolase [Verrucomicrobiales bacterium]|nr:RNA pyrophosphohydrolase [Verrucomicrobiales bacterium]